MIQLDDQKKERSSGIVPAMVFLVLFLILGTYEFLLLRKLADIERKMHYIELDALEYLLKQELIRQKQKIDTLDLTLAG